MSTTDNLRKKAQAISIDFYLSLGIFIIILALGVTIWHNSMQDISWSIQINEMDNYANKIADSLIRSKGYPLDWDNNSVELLGLVEKSHILSYQKALEMKNISVNKMNSLFGHVSYNLYIEINNISNLPVIIDNVNLTWGSLNNNTANSVTKAKRFSILHNKDKFERVSVNVFIWN